MFHTRGQATTRTSTRRASATGRPRSIPLVLALLAAVGASLAGAAPSAAQATVRLELTPARALTEVRRPIRYSAELVAANNRRQDVTSRTTLRSNGPAPCHQDSVIPGQLSCDDNGVFKITGAFGNPEITSEPAELEVVNGRVPPAFESTPAPSPPNREVTVVGLTGSCSQTGTLTSRELRVAQKVAGVFTARFTIPPGTFPGSYPLSLVVTCDGQPQRATAEIVVSNQPPDAVDDQATVTPGESVTIPVSGNDTDPDGDDGYRTLLEADPPTLGTAAVEERDQTIEYTAGPGFIDHDQFTYRSCDVVDASGKADCDQATVTVTRRDPEPVDDPDETTVQETAVSILVTRNDTAPDPARLRVRRGPGHGTAVVERQRDGNIEYTPEDRFTGKDTFEYDYCEGVFPPNVVGVVACPPATVTVDVRPSPTSPEITTVTLNPTPPNRAAVVTGTTGSCSRTGMLILHLPSPGTDVSLPVTAGQDGAFEQRLAVPGGTFVGIYRLELRVDCQGKVQVAEKPLEVANRPPTAVDDPAATSRDTPVTIDVTGNDGDPDGDDGYQTSLIADRPADGRADVRPDNRIRYTPDKGFVGVDHVRYRFCDVVDAAGTTDCGVATVTVAVGASPPKAVDDTASTVRDRPVRIDVTKNDTDPDVAKLRVLRPVRPGARAEQQPDGSVLYSPEPGFTGTDTFRYDYCGGSVGVDAAAQGACSSATVTVAVTRPDPMPVDDPDATTLRDQSVVIDVMQNDHDPDAAMVRVRSRPAPQGAADLLPGGTIRYTPEPGFTGTDRFQYDYCRGSVDPGAAGQAACPAATVTVAVTAMPVISSVRPGSTAPGRTVEVDGNSGSCSRTGTLALHGTGAVATVAAAQDGGFTIRLTVPPGTFPGTYRLELRVDCNGRAQRADGSLTVTNHAPVATDDTVTTTRDHPVSVEVTANDRDPDDPDGYATLVLVSSPPSHGTAEVQADNQVRYTPDEGFSGRDRFGYSLCDDMLNANGTADCGAATVTVRVDPRACVPPAGASPPLHVDPVKGAGGTSLRITATVDRGLAACPLRLLLGGTPLGPDVGVRSDGNISEERQVPGDARPGPSSLRLATLTAQTVAETPFEVAPIPSPAGLSLPFRLLVGVGALLAGALARAAFRRWRRLSRQERRAGELPDDIRVEPHPRPVEVTVEPEHDTTRTFTVRLESHPDPGNQTVQEVNP